MRREIHEIPDVVARVSASVHESSIRLATAISRRPIHRVVLVGRGTSDHAAIYGRYLTEVYLGVPASLAAPSVTTVYGGLRDWRDTLLIAVSQSGQGPDIVEVAAAARAGGAITAAVVNEVQSPLADAVEHVMRCDSGSEHSIAATKTYVAELAVLADLIGTLGHVATISDGLRRLPQALASAIEESERWIRRSDDLLTALQSRRQALVVSRGFNIATAYETALKMQETAGIFAIGYSSAELLHGPVVLAEAAVPVLVFRPDGPIGRVIDDSIASAHERGARQWVVGGREIAHRDEDGQRAFAVQNGVIECLSPLIFVIPGQLLAETLARELGKDPDAPPGLTKVTRTR